MALERLQCLLAAVRYPHDANVVVCEYGRSSIMDRQELPRCRKQTVEETDILMDQEGFVVRTAMAKICSP